MGWCLSDWHWCCVSNLCFFSQQIWFLGFFCFIITFSRLFFIKISFVYPTPAGFADSMTQLFEVHVVEASPEPQEYAVLIVLSLGLHFGSKKTEFFENSVKIIDTIPLFLNRCEAPVVSLETRIINSQRETVHPNTINQIGSFSFHPPPPGTFPSFYPPHSPRPRVSGFDSEDLPAIRDRVAKPGETPVIISWIFMILVSVDFTPISKSFMLSTTMKYPVVLLHDFSKIGKFCQNSKKKNNC